MTRTTIPPDRLVVKAWRESTATLPDETPAAENGEAFPLTCEWCRSAPASHLLVVDWCRLGRSASAICHGCAHRDAERAREVAASWSSVWLFELHPDACPARKTELEEG